MSYIYIDESEDLGTKKSSSRYFVIAAIKVEDPRKLDRIINKVRDSTKKRIITSNEIKGSNLLPFLKLKILKKLSNVDYEVFIIVFDKINRFKIGYEYDNKELYDILASQLAKMINLNNSTFIFVDKSKNKQEEITNFNRKFIKNLHNLKKHHVAIEHVNSMHYKGLQITDFISWSAFQKFERENNEYFDLINNKSVKVICEN